MIMIALLYNVFGAQEGRLNQVPYSDFRDALEQGQIKEVTIKDGKIENYQVITPTAWNIGPRDGKSVNGPMEQAFIGTPIADAHDPVELGHVARSFDSCLVCTVHAYDAKSGKELAQFTVNGAC